MTTQPDFLPEMEEPLITPNPKRFVIFPLTYERMWDMFKAAQSNFWVAEELDLQKDGESWRSLKNEEMELMLTAVGLILVSHHTRVGRPIEGISNDVQISEARCFFGFQIAMENIHLEALTECFGNILEDLDKKLLLLENFASSEYVKKKSRWIQKWLSNELPIGNRIVALVVLSSVFSCASITILLWFRSRCLLPGVSDAFHFIARDMNVFKEFALLLYNYVETKPSHLRIEEIVDEAVAIEKECTLSIQSTNILGMNHRLLCGEVEAIAAHILQQLGCDQIRLPEHPFPFMENVFSKCNYGQYFKQKTLKSTCASTTRFKLDEDF